MHRAEHTTSRRQWWCRTLCGALLLSSCTTVSRTSLSASSDPRTGRTASAAAAGTAGGASSDAGAAGGGGLSGGGGGSVAGTGAAGGTDAGAAGTACQTPVKLGVSYSSDLAAGLAAVGNPGAAGDAANYAQEQQQLFQRSADDLNARGGLAGCPVTLVFHDFKVLAADGFAGESQTECSHLAEDEHVFAVVSTTLENKTLVDCLAQHHVVSIFLSEVFQPTPSDYQSYHPYLYEPNGITPYRFGPFVDQIDTAGYFSPAPKAVGILLADDGSGTNQYLVDQVWTPQLAKRGIKPVVFSYPLVQNVSDNSAIASEFQSAVLKFKAAGVDHVMVTPDNGDAAIFFTQVAESQGYRPRYAMTTASSPAGWSTAPAGQRTNAVNVSFSLIDLGGNPDPNELATNPASPGRDRCDALYSGHTGVTPITSAYNICDAFELLRLGLNGASAVTPDTLAAGVDSLGDSLSLAGGYGNATFAPPDRYDGGSATRVMEWDDAGSKWHFVSDPGAIP